MISQSQFFEKTTQTESSAGPHFIAWSNLAVVIMKLFSFSGPRHLLWWRPCLLTTGPTPPVPPSRGRWTSGVTVPREGEGRDCPMQVYEDRHNGALNVPKSHQLPYGCCTWKVCVWGMRLWGECATATGMQ